MSSKDAAGAPHTSKLPRIQRSSLRHTAPRGSWTQTGVFETNMDRVDTCWIPSLPIHANQTSGVFSCFSTVASSWLLSWPFLFGWLCSDDTSLKGWKVPVQILAHTAAKFPSNTEWWPVNFTSANDCWFTICHFKIGGILRLITTCHLSKIHEMDLYDQTPWNSHNDWIPFPRILVSSTRLFYD